MAQSAGFMAQDIRTDMGIPVFWTSSSSEPPWNLKICLDQFKLAVTVKENVNPEIILEDPKEVVGEPMPRPETPAEAESAHAVTNRQARNRLRGDKVILENQERSERGPKVGHNVFYNEVQKRITSRISGTRYRGGKEIRAEKPTCGSKYPDLNLEKWCYWPKHHSRKHETSRTSDIDSSPEPKNQGRRWNRSKRH